MGLPLPALFCYRPGRTVRDRRTTRARTVGPLGATGAAGRLALLDDHRLDGRLDARRDLDDDQVRADRLDRLLEGDVPAVDAQAARLTDGVGDVLRGDGPEQPAVLAGLVGDRQDGLVEHGGGVLRL